MASKLSSLANKVIKNVGKNVDDINFSEVKDILKGRGLANSSVNEATKVVEEVIENRRGIASAFEKGVTIGSAGNEIVVPKGGATHKGYNKLVHNKNASPEEALELLKKKQHTISEREAIQRELAAKEANKKRDAIIQNNRDRTEKLRRNEIKREIAANYATPETANGIAKEIADTIEQRGGYVGSDPSAKPKSKLKGETPKSTPGFKELKKNRYNSKEDYMKFRAASEYEDIVEAYNKKDFDNSILKDKNIDKTTTMERIQEMRDAAINNAPGELGGFRDWMGYNRVPQKVTGVAGTAWLVNKLAATGGQQTNSQLYGQTPY